MITKEHRLMCCEFKSCVEGAVHKSLHKETHKTYISTRESNRHTNAPTRANARTNTHADPKASLFSYLLLPSSVSINQEFPLSPPSISSLPPLLRHPLPLFSPHIPPNRWSGSSMAGGAAGVGGGERGVGGGEV